MLSKYFITRVVNVALRVMALVSKFVLVIVLAKLFSPSDVGLYGLITAMLVFSLLVIGCDFYAYSLRELLSRSQNEWSFVLQHHLLALLILYVFLLPAQWFIFAFDFLPIKMAGYFFLLLILEHFSQEINRLLVAMKKPLTASMVLFFRMGAWVWVVLAFMWVDQDIRSLEFVFLGWAIGCVFAIMIGLASIWRAVEKWRFWPIDKSWIKKGFKVGLLFLMGSLSMRAILTFDRFAVESLVGGEFLGVYVVYIGMAMAIVNVMDPAVFSFLYPRLVEAYSKGNYSEYDKIMREMLYVTLSLSVILGLCVYFLAPFVFDWIGKPVYSEHQSILLLLICASIAYVIGMIPHFGLYAKGKDKKILFAHLSSAALFLLLIFILSGVMHEAVVPSALLLSFIWMGLVKFYMYKNILIRL
jgi:O-antigen/teichoic acid export membrane protein